MPIALSEFLEGHEVGHVDVLGLKSPRNGALLADTRENFDCLMTLDRGILYQQNHLGQSLRFVVLRVRDSRQATVLARLEDLISCLDEIAAGEHREI